MNVKDFSKREGEVDLTPVDFELRNDKASLVCVAGSFNDWEPESGRMTRENKDHWVRTFALPAGAHEYLLVVDGEWLVDPINPASVENPYGGRNSLFTVAPANHALHDRNAALQTIAGEADGLREQLRTRASKLCAEIPLSAGENSTAGRTCLGPRPTETDAV